MKNEMWNDVEFSTGDLWRLTEIQDSKFITDNEKFLCSLIDKMFIRLALLQDDVDTLKLTLEQA
jgi:hypothetical protein